MSVQIIPALTPLEAQLVSINDGHDCGCRSHNHNWIKRPKKDFLSAPSSKESMTLDLGSLLKKRTSDSVTVFINCGSVPVDEKRYWEIKIINSDRTRKDLTCKNFRVDETNADVVALYHSGVFRIVLPSKHEEEALLPYLEGQHAPSGRGNSDASKRTTFRVMFNPPLPNVVYTKTYPIWVDNVLLNLRLRGHSTGPSVCLNRDILNFGGIYVGNSGKRALELHNSSSASAHFQFQIDNMRSVFNVCPTYGTIPAFGTVRIEASFHPFAAKSFYRRLYCLVHHQEPLIVDFIGICLPRPRFLPSPIAFGVKMEQETALPRPIDTFEDFITGFEKYGIKFDTQRVDFGYRDPEASYPDNMSGMHMKIISTLPYDIFLEWSPDSTKVFTVFPASCILEAKGTFTFAVNFKPNFPGAFYEATLECYVHPSGDAWEQGGPPWALAQSELGSPPSRQKSQAKNSSRLQSKTEQVHKEEKETTKRQTVSSDVVAASIKGKTKSIGASSQLPQHAPSNSNQDGMTADGASRQSVKSSRTTISQPPANGKPPELLPGGGYVMKVNMTRLNSETEAQFTIAPVTKDVSVYDLPEELGDIVNYHPDLKDDSSEKSHCGLTKKKSVWSVYQSNMVAGAKLHDVTNEDKLSRDGSNNLPLTTDSSILIPSVHPSKLILPGNEEAEAHFLDTIQRVALPMCITMKASGHTFCMERVSFIPDVKLPNKAVMNASVPGASVGRTLMIKNLSDLPCFYDLDAEHADSADSLAPFLVRPRVGLIPGNQHEILVVRLLPKLSENPIHQSSLGITFNLQDNCTLGLYGYCEIPSLGVQILNESSDNGNEVVCPITIAGCVSTTFMELRNPTGFHYRFWIEPADVEEETWMIVMLIISPQPSSGFMAPNETVPISWKFAPREDGTFYLYWRFCFQVSRTCLPTDLSLAYYELIIPFTGIARTSYLEADPSYIDFDVVQIFEPKSRTTIVRNSGECPVNAHFLVHHDQWLADFPPELVSIHPTKVTLQAHETVEVTITVKPSKPNLQKFHLIYNLEFGDSDEFVQGVYMDVFDKHIVDFSFTGDHAVFKITDIVMDSKISVWDAEQCWSMFSLSLLNQLLTPEHHVTPEGVIPAVSSVSLQFPAAVINSPPCTFKLHLSNVRELKGFWAISKKPPTGWRSHLQLQRKVWWHNCRASEFNDGQNISDNSELASQIWARKFDFTSSQVNQKGVVSHCNSLKDLSLFEITPTSGSLKSKESHTITLKYSYTTKGTHEVSVLLRIFPGIFVWLDLFGKTLDEHEPFLQMSNQKQMVLHPVLLSDMDPPIQMFWMYNGGNHEASFDVDMEPFEALKGNNFGHPVIECLTPSGSVRPRSWFPIQLRFSPLEYVDYSVPLRIYPTFDETLVEVVVLGTAAINPSACIRPAATSETMRKFVLFAQGVPVTLSPSHVTISHLIHTGHSVSRILFLTNLHVKNTMKYFWQTLPIEGGGSISVHPHCGRIAPKEEVPCKIVIQAGDTATIMSTMIACSIEDETTSTLYEFVLGQWPDLLNNEKGSNGRVGSTGKDSQLQNNEKLEKPEEYNRLLAVSFCIGSTLGQFDNIGPKEKSRMGFVNFLGCTKCGKDMDNANQFLPFTPKGTLLCQSILRNMIWDMIRFSNFGDFLREATKKKAPLFEEYVEMGIDEKDADSLTKPGPKTLMVKSTAEILERSTFNILQEMAKRFAHSSTTGTWFDISPVQSKASVDVDQ